MPQVWNLVAGDSSSLTKPQFYSTLRLISLAQACIHCVKGTALSLHKPSLVPSHVA